ncbi:hypothetical protein WJX74_003115 [Apatococcus lobatus]|uniref:Uncharacterized protein n=1 Tax=Apatococcus lobatus TaxID=904363 RepID=A0AAW1S9R3_9CHLO
MVLKEVKKVESPGWNRSGPATRGRAQESRKAVRDAAAVSQQRTVGSTASAAIKPGSSYSPSTSRQRSGIPKTGASQGPSRSTSGVPGLAPTLSNTRASFREAPATDPSWKRTVSGRSDLAGPTKLSPRTEREQGWNTSTKVPVKDADEEFLPLTQSQSLTARDIQAQLPAGISRSSSSKRSVQQPSYGSLSTSRTRRSAAGEDRADDAQPYTTSDSPQTHQVSTDLQYLPPDQHSKRQRLNLSEEEPLHVLASLPHQSSAPRGSAEQPPQIASTCQGEARPSDSIMEQPAETITAGFSRDSALFALMQHRLPSLSKSQGLQSVPEQQYNADEHELGLQNEMTDYDVEIRTATSADASAQAAACETPGQRPVEVTSQAAASTDSEKGSPAKEKAGGSHQEFQQLKTLHGQQAKLQTGVMESHVASASSADAMDIVRPSEDQQIVAAQPEYGRDHHPKEDVSDQPEKLDEAHGMQPAATEDFSPKPSPQLRPNADGPAHKEEHRDWLHINIQLNDPAAHHSPTAELSSDSVPCHKPQQKPVANPPFQDAQLDHTGTHPGQTSPLLADADGAASTTTAAEEMVNAVPLDTAKTAVLLANLPAPPGSAGLQPKSPRKVPSLLPLAQKDVLESPSAPPAVEHSTAKAATHEPQVPSATTATPFSEPSLVKDIASNSDQPQPQGINVGGSSADAAQTAAAVSQPRPLAVVVPTTDVSMPVASVSPVNLPKAPGSAGKQQSHSPALEGPQANGTKKHKVGQAILCCFMPRMQTDATSHQAFEDVRPNAPSSSNRQDAARLKPKQKMASQGSGIKDISGAIMSKLRGKPAGGPHDESSTPAGPTAAEALAGVADDDHAPSTVSSPIAAQSSPAASNATGTWQIQAGPGITSEPSLSSPKGPAKGAHPSATAQSTEGHAPGSDANPSSGSALSGTSLKREDEVHAVNVPSSHEMSQLESAMSIAPQPTSPGAMSRLVSIGKSGLGASKKGVMGAVKPLAGLPRALSRSRSKENERKGSDEGE